MVENSFTAGNSVLYSTNGQVGVITGKLDKFKDRWQVKFNGKDLIWVPGEKLSLVPDKEDPFDLFQQERFQTISDFRRCLYRYRMSGELTNIMYSMDNAVTTFMPHQFIPVIKFLESYTDRLLIADEVGLGKTIEAMYIWEELRARKNAKRLLVVVPAVLRDKWKNDMQHFFGIDAEVVSSQRKGDDHSLLNRIEEARRNPSMTRFALIVSIEGLRVADQVREILEACKDVENLFDMTVIDEAHYYRNQERETFDTGEQLRDVSSHLVLLSATPIQTSSENFYNLLRLLAPEEFDNHDTFEAQLMENRPLVRLSNALERHEGADVVAGLVREAQANDVFAKDEDLEYLSKNLEGVLADPKERVSMIGRIKGKYFYSGFVTRSRKREVMPNRIQRKALPVNFRLSDYEYDFYNRVTGYLRAKDEETRRPGNFSTFRLIMRQRQMASCIPAALRAWRGIGVDDDYDEEVNADREQVQRMSEMPAFEEFDLERLEENDSKFNRILDEVNRILLANPQEKIVIFSFFRTTVRYLIDRLGKSGISVIGLMGGLGREDKSQRLAAFKDSDINVLVSTEVGSEGIDLQFARYELNYDLPWNPMRLEQRIGRIDRIGQEHDPIFICNAYCENTIEDRILQRLYERIATFQDVIGDLEEILGEKTDQMACEVFRSGELTEDEIAARADQVVDAMCHQQKLAKSLELEAGMMSSDYQNFVLQNICKAREANRLLTPAELMFFCQDVLLEKYVGSSVLPVEGSFVADVRLSEDARRALTNFVANHSLAARTQLGSAPAGLRCKFGRQNAGLSVPADVRETIDVNHPLVRWLLEENEKEAIYASGCEVVSVLKSDLPESAALAPGFYAYGIQRWKTNGVRHVNELRYYLAAGQYDENAASAVVTGDEAEQVLVATMMRGKVFDVNLLNPDDYNACGMALSGIADRMDADFNEFEADQKGRNATLVEEQSKYVERTASIKATKLQESINKMLLEGKKKGAELNRAKLPKIIQARDERLAMIKGKLDCSPEYQLVSVGILNVREG